MEINARLGGGIPLAIAAGVDVPGLLLAHAAGRPIARPELDSYELGLYMTRSDESIFLTEDECAEIAGDRLRSG